MYLGAGTGVNPLMVNTGDPIYLIISRCKHHCDDSIYARGFNIEPQIVEGEYRALGGGYFTATNLPYGVVGHY
jgi:hypothetical protein